MENVFKSYMASLAEAMRQELPDVTDTRAEFTIDGVPYVFTADEDNSSIFVYAIIGALPPDDDERAGIFAGFLHAQYCFSDSCGFSFGVDEDNTFALLQALVNIDCCTEEAFVTLMDKFVKAANVWTRRLAEPAEPEPPPPEDDESSPALFV